VKLTPRKQVAFGAIALVLGACASAPLFLSNYPLFVLSLAIVNAIAVLGLNLVMGCAGQISLGQAGFAAIGAYATALLVVNLDVSYWLALLLGASLAAICGYILGLPALRLGPPGRDAQAARTRYRPIPRPMTARRRRGRMCFLFIRPLIFTSFLGTRPTMPPDGPRP